MTNMMDKFDKLLRLTAGAFDDSRDADTLIAERTEAMELYVELSDFIMRYQK